MPITFVPPAPAGAFSGVGGKAQAMLQDFGPIASAYGQAASLRMQGAIAEVQGRNAATQGDANRQQQSREFADTFADSQNRFQAGLNEQDANRQSQEEMQSNALQAHAAAQVRGAYIDNWLGQQKMTFADTLKAQRTDKDIADLEQAAEDGTISKEQRDYGIAQLMGTKSKLDLKQQQAQTQVLTETAKHLVAQSEMQEAAAQKVKAIQAANENNAWTPMVNSGKRPEVERLVRDIHPELAAAMDAGGVTGAMAKGAFEQLVQQKALEMGPQYAQRFGPDGKGGRMIHPQDEAALQAMAKGETAQVRRQDDVVKSHAEVMKGVQDVVSNLLKDGKPVDPKMIDDVAMGLAQTSVKVHKFIQGQLAADQPQAQAKAQQATESQAIQGKLSADVDTILKSNVPAHALQQGLALVTQLRDLTGRYADKAMDPELQRRYDALMTQYAQWKKAVLTPAALATPRPDSFLGQNPRVTPQAPPPPKPVFGAPPGAAAWAVGPGF